MTELRRRSNEYGSVAFGAVRTAENELRSVWLFRVLPGRKVEGSTIEGNRGVEGNLAIAVGGTESHCVLEKDWKGSVMLLLLRSIQDGSTTLGEQD